MEEKVKKLEEHLNHIWSLIPNKPTYGEFNKIFPVEKNVEILRNFEKENNWFLIARYNTEQEGITILSMFASITDYLTNGWRLSFMAEQTEKDSKAGIETPIENQIITGFKMIRLEDYSSSSNV